MLDVLNVGTFVLRLLLRSVVFQLLGVLFSRRDINGKGSAVFSLIGDAANSTSL